MDGYWGIWNKSPPLCVTVMCGRFDIIVEILLLSPTIKIELVLGMAVKLGYIWIRRYIDVNLYDFDRCTPLWWVVKRGYLDIVVQLVNDSRTVFNSRIYRCPRDEVKFWGYSDIANLLTYVIDKKNLLTFLN
ncbi:hypothetical protein BDV37DRAFT_276885 [Aspergillus pseudonomiae]|uniref:Ankyrin repeat-containing domain protein n=1 Tax=Aspergillus pseudonomiae TaxID=1506151 RepID=A0A5N7CUV7_9EURO|nr:uncharacterized protein BDV37DRAFT_276885 [Aspergillus pseudonomiae]KAE8397507.1 hypothetical protein BDV37DRAFT_276885 [Aspergillus pseudonomiae]